ncbi:MAG TPA: glycosyltransferase family 4 protein [Kiritimatiellia bacterium]|nr:glycosyltransferase family 4 protein [Kiritimatiellia bacterium]HPJ56714.1 glycosyltransferase family 4 protein [Kiritimatiellia bacterium]
MRILYIHQFFAGPDSPGPAQPRALVRRLAERGHAVEVLACDLNAYNEQAEPEETTEMPGGGSVRVRRLPVPSGLRASLANRLKTYGTFAWRAWRFGRRQPAPDVVMASIQPLFGGVAALRLARRWRRPFLLEIRDLWPDALVVKKAIAPWQAAPLQALARSLYAGADRVVCLTPGLKTEILAKGISPARVDVFPNGCDETQFRIPPGGRERLRTELGWSDSFVAVYTGTHTEVTAMDTIVRAAAALRDRRDIRLDLFGTGQSKPGAIALARELGLDNIHFHDPVPKSRVPAILAAADAGLMTLFRSPLIHIYFENKFIDYMGAGLPILASLEGVQADLIRQAGAGVVVPTFDSDALARAIAEAADHPEQRRAMGEAGHRFIRSRLAQPDILNRYAEVLEAVAQGQAGSMPPWDPFQERGDGGQETGGGSR